MHEINKELFLEKMKEWGVEVEGLPKEEYKIKARVRKQLAPWMSVKVMFYISKDQSQLLFVEGEDLYCRLVMKWRD